jgi:glutathione S-transferase
MTLVYVDVDTARDLAGTRLVTSALVPSPWSEAAKGLFTVAQLPAHVVAKTREAGDAVKAWTGVDNVPVVLHDKEPARTNWAAIVGLAARLDAASKLVPPEPSARARMFGVLEAIAGEQGLGWTARLAMIQASLESNGERGFTLGVATYLAKRYGHTAAVSPSVVRDRVQALLTLIHGELGARTWFGGDAPNALDVYAATFLTPLTVIDDDACPQITPQLRKAFGAASELLHDLVPAPLWAHRTRMFERHLAWPIRLS